MTWYLLSERMLERESAHISWGINYEFEDVFVKMTGAQILAPLNNSVYSAARRMHPIGRYTAAMVDRTYGRFESYRLTEENQDRRALLVVGMGSRSLRILRAIRNIRKEFDIIVVYILDSFEPYPRDVADKIDHLFTIIPEMQERLIKQLSVPVHFVPAGCDTLGRGGFGEQRGIDVLAYGRQPPAFARELDNHFLKQVSHKLYLTSFSHPRATSWSEQRRQFWRVLNQTRISLAFVPRHEDDARFQGLPVISARWYEGLSAGCVMVGKPPETETFARLFDWEDAVVRLGDPTEAPEVIEKLLADESRLRRAHLRNHLMMLKKLDARRLITRMLGDVGMEVPECGQRELQHLNDYTAALEARCVEEGIITDAAPVTLGV